MHKKTQWGLAAICVLTVVFGWRLATQVPVYAKPLEVYHSEMVDALKTLKALPPIKPHVILQEYHQPPLYYGVTALLSAFDPPIQNRPAQALNPHYLATLIGNRNQYLPYQPGTPTVYVGRLVSMALVLVTVVMTYMQAQMFLPGSLAFLAAALLAFQPEFLFIGTSISNDIAVTAMAAVTLWWYTRLVKTTLRPRSMFGLGVLIGLAAMCKVHALLLLATVPFLLWHYRRLPIRQLVLNALSVGIGTALIAGPWLLHNLITYQDALALSPVTGGPVVDSIGKYLLVPLPDMWKSFWLDYSAGIFGYGPNFYYLIVGVILVFALVGIFIVLIRNVEQRLLLSTHAFIIGLTLILSIYQKARILASGETSIVGEGRHLFIMLPSLMILIAASLQAIPGPRVRLAVGYALSVASLFALLWAIGPHLNDVYGLASGTLPPPPQAIRFANGMEVQGYSAARGTFDGKSGWYVDLQWTTSAPIDRNLSVSVQVMDWKDKTLDKKAQQDSYPGDGLAPTLTWKPGNAVRERYFVPGEGTMIGIFVYDLKTGQNVATADNQYPLITLPVG